MYKKALYRVCEGELCHAAQNGDNVIILSREGERIIRRQMDAAGGKIFGARAVSYADSYFEFPFATLEVIGEEIVYERKADNGAQNKTQNG